MSHFNEIVVKTAKAEGSTIEDIKASLSAHYPDFAIQDVKEQEDAWTATLLREISAAEVAKMAALPFEEEVEEVDELPEEEEGGVATSSPASDDTEDEKDSEEEHGHLESLLLEIKNMVQKLEEKAGLVDEIHERTKEHVEAPSPEKIGPTAPGGGNPLGVGVPGNKPPMAPNASTKIAYASIEQDGFEFSMTEVMDAIQERYADYNLVEIKKDVAKNRYVAKLELK